MRGRSAGRGIPLLRRGLSAPAVLGRLLCLACFLPAAAPLPGQLPGDDLVRPRGQGVAPVFEGWYEAPDGRGLILSFGYRNRNGERTLDLPPGPSNQLRVRPSLDGPLDGDAIQPTHFRPGRWWGVFAVEVPTDFDSRDVVWTLDARGERYEIPGRITSDHYRIDALRAPATGLTPPALAFEPSASSGRGPRGVRAEPRRAVAGEPLELTVWVRDDTWRRDRPGTERPDGGAPREVVLRWQRYRGAGEVRFRDPRLTVPPPRSGERVPATTAATFSRPGDYVLYVRADNRDLAAAGAEQCCWTNGYVPVRVVPGAAPAPDPDPTVTYARDVAPILNERCVVCHRRGSIGPMPLTSYEDARRWAPLIRRRVEERTMPPWHLDPTVGVQRYVNDRSLTERQIRTLVRWVEAGAPRGPEEQIPPPPELDDGRAWRLGIEEGLGPPDLVVRTDPFTVPARGPDRWWRPVVPTGVEEARWLRAIEVRPSPGAGRSVTHHVLVGLDQAEPSVTGLASTARGHIRSPGLLTEFAIGKAGEIFPENTGKLLLPGSRLEFEVHYWPSGERIEGDRVEVGMWFYDRDERPRYRTVLRAFNASPRSTLEIPPHRVTRHDRSYVLAAPARLESFQPHMHMRGKAMAMEAVLPDGQRRTLAVVDRFQFAWHVNYIFETEAAPLLPKGTTLHFTVWHDNTANHPTNPDPDQFVTWGDRAVDEMGHAWVGVTYLEQEDFERMRAQRMAHDGGASPGDAGDPR